MGNSVGGERRAAGISWREQTLASMAAPPTGLMVVFGVVVLLLYGASYADYRAQVERSLVGFKLLLFLLPLLLILVVHLMVVGDRWLYNLNLIGNSRTTSLMAAQDQVVQGGGFPWWLLLLLLLLLVLIYYHSFIKSTWFHPLF